MSKTLPVYEVKARLPELVTGVDEREEEVVVRGESHLTERGGACGLSLNQQ